MQEPKTEKGIVLIVDDTISIINMVKTTLSNHNYQILIATSGENAIKIGRMAKPDLILLDILMPEMDGYETCKRLKADNDTKDIPVLFMSALTDVFDKVKAFNVGAVDYVTKPLNIEELLARVDTHVRLSKMQKKLKETNEWLEKKLEREIAKREERFELAMQATHDGLFDWDLVTNEIYYSPGWKKMLGYEEHELENNFSIWEKLTAPDDVKKSWQMLNDHIEGRLDRFEMEFKMLHKKGHWVDILARANAVFNKKGKAIRIVGTHVDVTERKAVEKALRDEKEFTDIALDNQIDTFFLFDPETGRALRWNIVFREISGYTDAEIACLEAPYSYYSKEDLVKVEGFIQEVLKLGHGIVELEIIRKNDDKVPCEYNVAVIHDKNGKRYLIFVGRDITKRKLAEEELKEKNTFIQTVLDRLPIGVALNKFNEGNATYMNKKFEEIYGWSFEELKNVSSFFERVYPDKDYRENITKRVIADINSGITERMHWENIEITQKNGHKRIINASNIPLFEQNTMVSTVIDITRQREYEMELEKHRNHLELLVKERTDDLETSNKVLFQQKEKLEKTISALNKTQAKLIQSEKMASLGVLVAGVAHEINNPVNFINSSLVGLKNNLQYLMDYADLYQHLNDGAENALEKIKEKEKEASLSEILEMFRRSIEIIEVGIERTTKIVKGLKAFARSDEKKLELYDLHESIENTLLILYNKFKNRIEISKKFGEIPEVECFPSQINQVIMNVLNNAIQAVEHEGSITIKTTLSNENKVIIEITDTGIGIPEGQIKHIFDPFFTTKDVGKGTGLGLSISYGIIKDHNGEITVESGPGKGTCFKIVLPVSQATKK